MIETENYLSQHPSQESLETVIGKAKSAANRLETFLHRKPSDVTGSVHDYNSIASELMNLQDHEDALRRELQAVGWDMAGCASEVLCSGSFDEDENVLDCLGGPSGADDAFEVVRSMAMREEVDSDDELSRLDIPLKPSNLFGCIPDLLPASPWSSFRSDRSNYDDDSLRSRLDDDDYSVPGMITFHDEKPRRVRKTSSQSFGLRHQLSQDDFQQLQDDLEAALEDFNAVDQVEEPEKKVSIVWAFIVRLAELLYGQPEPASVAKLHVGLSRTVEL